MEVAGPGTVGGMATQDPGSTTIKPLTPETWDLFAALVERHNGIFGGCWCVKFHPERADHVTGYDGNRAFKKCLVEEGIAHAALVVRDGEDGEEAIAWAEYGTPAELPDIHHSKQYLAGAGPRARLPDHLHLRRQEVPPERSGDRRPGGCARADRAGGRRRRRGLPSHSGRAATVLVVPLQRHEGRLRARRLRLHPAQGTEEHRDAPSAWPRRVSHRPPAGGDVPRRKERTHPAVSAAGRRTVVVSRLRARPLAATARPTATTC